MRRFLQSDVIESHIFFFYFEKIDSLTDRDSLIFD